MTKDITPKKEPRTPVVRLREQFKPARKPREQKWSALQVRRTMRPNL